MTYLAVIFGVFDLCQFESARRGRLGDRTQMQIEHSRVFGSGKKRGGGGERTIVERRVYWVCLSFLSWL